jgi:ribonuclease HII
MKLIAGVDEVGRGPLAGPVMACAIILHPDRQVLGLADSKVLSEKKRENLFTIIQKNCLAWAVGRASVEEIDKINILQATLLAMQRAIAALSVKPDHIQIDGNICPPTSYSMEAIVGGDGIIPVISAASILAKVIRDREMVEYDKIYPEYGFAQHKGYGTKQHLLAIRQFGITAIHRKSFAPVKNYSNLEHSVCRIKLERVFQDSL